MDCVSNRTDVVQLDNYCISCSAKVVGLDNSCICRSLNESQRTGSTLSPVVYVSVHWMFTASDGRNHKVSLAHTRSWELGAESNLLNYCKM